MKENLVIQAFMERRGNVRSWYRWIEPIRKDYYTESLSRELRGYYDSVVVFHIDDYVVDQSLRYHTGYDEWYEYYHLKWEARALEKELFKPLKENGKIGFVLVEGVFLQRVEWRSFMDFIVYLDCPRIKRFERASMEVQQNIEKFKQRYWKAEDYYIDQVNPKEKADLVIKKRTPSV